MADPLFTTRTQATEGLLSPSEEDAPPEPWVWPPADKTRSAVRRLCGHPARERCETLPAGACFDEPAEVGGCAAWSRTLQAILTDLRAYRCAEAPVMRQVVGRDGQARPAGCQTRAVETSPITGPRPP